MKGRMGKGEGQLEAMGNSLLPQGFTMYTGNI